MSSVIDEPTFRTSLEAELKARTVQEARSTTGPGRSGAIASVYASHILGIPWFPYGQGVPNEMLPVLIVDTAEKSGRTLRKAMRKYHTDLGFAVFHEPPRVKFWYEKN